jgi:CheY-like chemotaxis protein
VVVKTAKFAEYPASKSKPDDSEMLAIAIWPGRQAAEPRPSARETSKKQDSTTKSGAPAKRRRVLVVEDNIDTVRSFALLLREMGHEVEYAINGYAGLEVARRFLPEIVLLDLGLPGMDGFELCKRFKNDPQLRQVRVIAVTGYAQEEYRTRALAAGCEQHFVKPLAPAVLKGLLE